MSKLSDKTLVTAPLTDADVIVAQIGGQTKRVPARKVPHAVVSPYTAALTDTDGYIRVGDGSDETAQVAFTIPANADVAIPVGGVLTVECLSTGGLAIVAAAGVTIHPGSGVVYVLSQWGVAVATKVDTDEWTVAGAVEL